MMHRILLLSCNTGEGHNSAAKAIKEVLDARGESCEIIDTLALLSPKTSELICQAHVGIYRKIPKLFGAGYKLVEKVSSDSEEGSLYELMALGAAKLNNLILESGCTAAISVHPFSGLMLTAVLRRYAPRIVTGFVATDYTCSPFVNQSDLDYYFIPHENLREEFVNCGIPNHKIVASGIPIHQKFYAKKNAEESRRELFIAPEEKVALLMCGSMGCGPMKDLAEEISGRIEGSERLIVICGNNEKLREQLDGRVSSSRVKVLGYTHMMEQYMDAADVLITKAGGLSTTEAAAKGLPMVLIDAVAGCEEYNMEFFTKNGLALTDEKDDRLAQLVLELLENDEKRAEMSARLRENFSGNSAEIIYNTIQRGLEN